MTVPTLDGFLLARIAEDEAQAKMPDISRVAAPNALVAFRDPDATTLIIDPARVLAECEAKSRIVEYFCGPRVFDLADAVGISDSDRTPFERTMTYIERRVLGLLALPYADHEQFREEWRV